MGRIEPSSLGIYEHRVQVDIRQERRDDATLRSASFRVRQHPTLHHPGIEPLADEAQLHPVTYPPTQYLSG